MTMTLAVVLVFLHCVLYGIAYLWVVLPHEEIIDQSQACYRHKEDNGAHQAADHVFHQAHCKDDGHDGNDIENGVTHYNNQYPINNIQ